MRHYAPERASKGEGCVWHKEKVESGEGILLRWWIIRLYRAHASDGGVVVMVVPVPSPVRYRSRTQRSGRINSTTTQRTGKRKRERMGCLDVPRSGTRAARIFSPERIERGVVRLMLCCCSLPTLVASALLCEGNEKGESRSSVDEKMTMWWWWCAARGQGFCTPFWTRRGTRADFGRAKLGLHTRFN